MKTKTFSHYQYLRFGGFIRKIRIPKIHPLLPLPRRNVGVLTMNGSLKVWNARTGDLTFEQKVDAKNTRSLISLPKSGICIP